MAIPKGFIHSVEAIGACGVFSNSNGGSRIYSESMVECLITRYRREGLVYITGES